MNLWDYENSAKEKGFTGIAGTDEAGRGPLAGPVTAAAVILPDGMEIPGLNDSKKLTEKKREALFDEITACAVSYKIVSIDEKTIDKINILRASLLAMSRAAEGLAPKPELLLVDGNQRPDVSMAVQTIVKGDQKSASIAAASILAKVTRDRFMLLMDEKYPEYQFAKHKGYPTKLHRDLILQYGPCEIHRRSFLKKILGELG